MWKPDVIHKDGYSDFNKTCVDNLNILTNGLDVELWLISSRRLNTTLEEFQEIFITRNIKAPLVGFVPNNDKRILEVVSFIENNPDKNILIIDDDNTLHGLPENIKKFWTKPEYLIGFDNEKLVESQNKIKKWDK